jgi:hypothetical protein
VFFLALGYSSRFPGILGAEVDDARDSSWRHCFTVWIYSATKPSHVGVDVDNLAAIKRGHKASWQAPSCPIAAVGSDAFLVM